MASTPAPHEFPPPLPGRDPAHMLERTRAQWGGRGELWVFGYASLIWRPEFDAAEQHFLKDRVAFDLGCAEVQMIKLGGKAHITQQMTTQTWGGTGCGFKASYLVECVSNWGSIACTPRLNSKEALAQTAKPAVM